MSGKNIVGVQFRRAGKIYDFDGNDLALQLGDRVVVETERGLSLAEVKRFKVSFTLHEAARWTQTRHSPCKRQRHR